MKIKVEFLTLFLTKLGGRERERDKIGIKRAKIDIILITN